MKNAVEAFNNAQMFVPMNFAFTNEETRSVYRDAHVAKFCKANPELTEISVAYTDHDFAYQTAGAAAIDLYMPESYIVTTGVVAKVDLGIAVDLPIGLCALLLPRSSNGKQDFQVVLANGTGLIDSDYKGTIWAQFTSLRPGHVKLERGERFAQLIIMPYVRATPNLVEWESFKDSTARGIKGLGEGTGSQR